MTFPSSYEVPTKKQYLYKCKPYFILCNNYNGTVDIYQSIADEPYKGISYLGVERAVEKDKLVKL